MYKFVYSNNKESNSYNTGGQGCMATVNYSLVLGLYL